MIYDNQATDFYKAPAGLRLWLYNGLDNCITYEVHEALLAQMNAQQRAVYNFELDQINPALEMCWRGFLIDEAERDSKIKLYEEHERQIEKTINILSNEVCGRDLNPRSSQQLKELFYVSMKLPVQYTYARGDKLESMDRETLEKLSFYITAKPFVVLALRAKDIRKTLGFLRTGVDRDGRIRGAFNPSGTDTGRWSSNDSPFHSGTNLQNIKPDLRSICIADRGYRMGNVDLAQSESRFSGAYALHVTGRATYLDACESGDLHTRTASRIWPAIKTRADAEQSFYRDMSYRDMAKRGGHGTTYLGSARTMARHLKTTTEVMEKFQRDFFGAYPELRQWHQAVATELQLTSKLTTLFGRTRTFWGLSSDPATLRKAVAFLPQSASVDYLDAGIMRIFRDPKLRRVQLLAQGHDALTFQFPDDLDPAWVLRSIASHIEVPFQVRGRDVTVPVDASIGFNWGKYNDKNPEGLKSWHGADDRIRHKQPDPRRPRLFREPQCAGNL